MPVYDEHYDEYPNLLAEFTWREYRVTITNSTTVRDSTRNSAFFPCMKIHLEWDNGASDVFILDDKGNL